MSGRRGRDVADVLVVALVVVAVLGYAAAYVGLLWLTHRAIEHADYADAAVTALLFIALACNSSGSVSVRSKR